MLHKVLRHYQVPVLTGAFAATSCNSFFLAFHQLGLSLVFALLCRTALPLPFAAVANDAGLATRQESTFPMMIGISLAPVSVSPHHVPLVRERLPYAFGYLTTRCAGWNSLTGGHRYS